MEIVFAFLFSLLPVIVLLVLIYNLEEVKKQPMWLLLVLFLGGILSWVLVRYVADLLGSDIYRSQTEVSIFLGNIGFFLVSFSIIAAIEELSKFVIMYIFCIKNKHFTNPYDGIMYATCISLGFAFAENIMYILNYGMSVALSRALFSIPAHACFGIIMGYYLGLAQMCKKKNMKNDVLKLSYLGVFIPFIIHGLYDYLLNFQGKYIYVIFIVYVLLLYVISIYLMIRLSKVDMKKINRNKLNNNQKRVYNPDQKVFKNIYYDIDNQLNNNQVVLEKENKKESNWVQAADSKVIFEDTSIEMKMFKNDDE